MLRAAAQGRSRDLSLGCTRPAYPAEAREAASAYRKIAKNGSAPFSKRKWLAPPLSYFLRLQYGCTNSGDGVIKLIHASTRQQYVTKII